jgi:hypothetical protein
VLSGNTGEYGDRTSMEFQDARRFLVEKICMAHPMDVKPKSSSIQHLVEFVGYLSLLHVVGMSNSFWRRWQALSISCFHV